MPRDGAESAFEVPKNMISCPKCATSNTLDSAFCRKCGAALPQDLVQAEQVKLEELVALGMTAFSEGKTDEAQAIAENAVISNPNYADAHALKGMVHERKGEYAEALDALETVVALNPDSAIDKIKLNQLRTTIANRAAKEPESDKKYAWVMGISAAVLVLCVGVLIAKYGFNNTPPAGTTDSRLLANNGPQFNPTNTRSTADQEQGTVQRPPVTTNQGSPSEGNRPGAGDVPSVGGNTSPQVRTGTGLKPYTGPPINAGDTGGSLPPVTVNPGDITNPQVDRQDPRPPVKKTENIDPPVERKDPPKSKDNPGYISITDAGTTDPKPSAGGSESIDKGNGRETLVRVGDELYNGGDLAGAAKAYERALASGADHGRYNQRLGDIYRRLGQKSEAVAAYERALEVFQSRKAAGKGDPDATQRSIDSCQQAIKVLKG